MGKKSRKRKMNERLLKQGLRKRRKLRMRALSGESLSFSKHYFDLKGKYAEEVLHELAQKTFFTDWCYPNPRLPGGKELCDLLVVFDDIAIIWQLKDVKLSKTGNFKDSDMAKNVSQLLGARRQLCDLKVSINLENPRRGEELLDVSSISNVYLVSALFGQQPFTLECAQIVKGNMVHVLTRTFAEIILNELDTISDFCKYLRTKEDLLFANTSLIVLGGEEELLASYLRNDRSFEAFKDYDGGIMNEGIWSELQRDSQYIAKKKEDELSYVWDGMIERAHEGDNPEYEVIARELARHNRFQRRCLGKAIFDAHMIAHRSTRPFRRFLISESTVYCFLFQDDPEPREDRRAHLTAMCHVARSKYKDMKVIGIATEQGIRRTCSYDFVLISAHKWTKEDQETLDKIEIHKDILYNPKKHILREEEYPKAE